MPHILVEIHLFANIFKVKPDIVEKKTHEKILQKTIPLI